MRTASHFIRAQNGALTLDQLTHAVPSIAATHAHDSRSARFVPIPTSRIIEGLMQHGFQPVEARQGNSRIPGKADFTKHMVRFRHADADAHAKPATLRLGHVIPEIVLTNANDGTAAYSVEAGLWRLVCLNGLRVAGQQFVSHRIGHTGNPQRVLDQVLEASFSVVETTRNVTDAANRLLETSLSKDESRAFAQAAHALRWPPPDADADAAATPEKPPIDAAQLLQSRRTQDQAADLWTQFNVIQENLIRGGQGYRIPPTQARPRGQYRHVGEVKGIDQDRQINRGLWVLAEEMRRLKAA